MKETYSKKNEYHREYIRKWRAEHREQYLNTLRKYQKSEKYLKYQREYKREMLKNLNKCEKCGLKNIKKCENVVNVS